MPISRRTALIALGGAGLATGAAWYIRQRPSAPQDVDALMRRLVDTPTEQIALESAGWLRDGMPPRLLLDAAFHAPIVYQCDAADVHATLVAQSIAALSGQAEPEARTEWMAMACWSAEFTGQWLLSPTLERPARKASKATVAELLDAGEPDGLLGAIERDGLATAQRALLRRAGRDLTDPHRAIYAAQSMRALDTFGLHAAPFVLASVGQHLTRHSVAARRRFSRLQTLAARLPAEGPADAPTVAWLTARLQEPQPIDGLEQAAEMLTPATLLATVLRRAGQELRCARRASDAAIHAFTCTDALVAIHARTQDPIALLCAAVHLSERPCAVEGAPPADGPTDLIARARRASREHAVDPHHFKFAAALAAMSRHASPSERAYLRACAGRAPVFSSSEVWANAETVRLRLRG